MIKLFRLREIRWVVVSIMCGISRLEIISGIVSSIALSASHIKLPCFHRVDLLVIGLICLLDDLIMTMVETLGILICTTLMGLLVLVLVVIY